MLKLLNRLLAEAHFSAPGERRKNERAAETTNACHRATSEVRTIPRLVQAICSKSLAAYSAFAP